MKFFLYLAGLAFALWPLKAQVASSFPEGKTNWPGIHFQIMYLARVPPNRLLVGVRLIATSQAPPGGTLVGTPVPITPNADPRNVTAGFYHPQPFDMNSSVMTDELTQQSYPVVPTIAPPGRGYRPAIILATLFPGGGSSNMTLQFVVPPPPPPPPAGQPPVKQTLSFLFTNAKAAITHVPLPPPAPQSP